MDWKHNQWFGLGAAAVFIIGIALVFLWNNQPPDLPVDAQATWKYQCDSTKEVFEVPVKDFEQRDVYLKFHVPMGTAVECAICGKIDAYQVYWCPECNEYIKYKAGQAATNEIVCPNGHSVPTVNQ